MLLTFWVESFTRKFEFLHSLWAPDHMLYRLKFRSKYAETQTLTVVSTHTHFWH